MARWRNRHTHLFQKQVLEGSNPSRATKYWGNVSNGNGGFCKACLLSSNLSCSTKQCCHRSKVRTLVFRAGNARFASRWQYHVEVEVAFKLRCDRD